MWLDVISAPRVNVSRNPKFCFVLAGKQCLRFWSSVHVARGVCIVVSSRVVVGCWLCGAVTYEPVGFDGLTGEKAGTIVVKRWVSLYDVLTQVTADHDSKFTSSCFDNFCVGSGIMGAEWEVLPPKLSKYASWCVGGCSLMRDSGVSAP